MRQRSTIPIALLAIIIAVVACYAWGGCSTMSLNRQMTRRAHSKSSHEAQRQYETITLVQTARMRRSKGDA